MNSLLEKIKEPGFPRVLPFLDFQTCFSGIGAASDLEGNQEIEEYFRFMLEFYTYFEQSTILNREVTDNFDFRARQVLDLNFQKELSFGSFYKISFVHTEAGLKTPTLDYEFIFMTGLLFQFWLHYTRLDPVVKYPKKLYSHIPKYGLDSKLTGMRFFDTNEELQISKSSPIWDFGAFYRSHFWNLPCFVHPQSVSTFCSELRLPEFKSDFIKDPRWYRGNTMFTFPVINVDDSIAGLKIGTCPRRLENRIIDTFDDSDMREVIMLYPNCFTDHRFKVLYPYFKFIYDFKISKNLRNLNYYSKFQLEGKNSKLLVDEIKFLESIKKYKVPVYRTRFYFNDFATEIYERVNQYINCYNYIGFSKFEIFALNELSKPSSFFNSSEFLVDPNVRVPNHFRVADVSKFENLVPLFYNINLSLKQDSSNDFLETILEYPEYSDSVLFRPRLLTEQEKAFVRSGIDSRFLEKKVIAEYYFRDSLLRTLHGDPYIRTLCDLYGLNFNEFLVMSLLSFKIKDKDLNFHNTILGSQGRLQMVRLDWLNLDPEEYESLAQFFEMVGESESLLFDRCTSEQEYQDALLSNSFTLRSPVVDSLFNIENRVGKDSKDLQSRKKPGSRYDRYENLVAVHKQMLENLRQWPTILRQMGEWQSNFDRSVNPDTAELWLKAGYVDKKFQVSIEDRIGCKD